MGSVTVDLGDGTVSSDTFTFAKEDETVQSTTLSTTTTVTTPHVTTVTTTTTVATTTERQTEAPAVVEDKPVTNSYVLNTSTHKFHKPTCGDVQKISAENYQEYSGSRDDVVSQGYEPCGHCKP